MTVIENKFDFGDLVYLRTDEDQKMRLVVAIKILPDGAITYYLSCGTVVSEHFEFELTEEKTYAQT